MFIFIIIIKDIYINILTFGIYSFAFCLTDDLLWSNFYEKIQIHIVVSLKCNGNNKDLQFIIKHSVTIRGGAKRSKQEGGLFLKNGGKHEKTLNRRQSNSDQFKRQPSDRPSHEKVLDFFSVRNKRIDTTSDDSQKVIFIENRSLLKKC